MTSRSVCNRLFVVLLAVYGAGATAYAEIGVLEFEQEGFDLETGTVYASVFPGFFPREVDFHFAYNAQTTNHIRLFQEYPAEVAFLDGAPFGNVCYSDLGGLTLTQNLIDEPLDYDDTFIVQTTGGSFFKVGYAEEIPGFKVGFSYEALVPCDGDIDCDGTVGQKDLGVLLAAYGTCEGDPGYNAAANIATSGPSATCVDQADLGLLLAGYGTTCR